MVVVLVVVVSTSLHPMASLKGGTLSSVRPVSLTCGFSSSSSIVSAADGTLTVGFVSPTVGTLHSQCMRVFVVCLGVCTY